MAEDIPRRGHPSRGGERSEGGLRRSAIVGIVASRSHKSIFSEREIRRHEQG